MIIAPLEIVAIIWTTLSVVGLIIAGPVLAKVLIFAKAKQMDNLIRIKDLKKGNLFISRDILYTFKQHSVDEDNSNSYAIPIAYKSNDGKWSGFLYDVVDWEQFNPNTFVKLVVEFNFQTVK